MITSGYAGSRTPGAGSLMSGHIVNRVVGASAAGFAAALAIAPLASASAPAPAASTAPQSPADGLTTQDASRQADVAPEVAPDFGFQKIRVGVQIKSGAYVPDGTNTGGTTVDIVETGPNAGT